MKLVSHRSEQKSCVDCEDYTPPYGCALYRAVCYIMYSEFEDGTTYNTTTWQNKPQWQNITSLDAVDEIDDKYIIIS